MTSPLIPDAALDKHVALLGMTGAGKSSVIRVAIVEPDLRSDRRVVIITPKDDWWGLRLSKSGKSKGFDIPIFGGSHADYPLQVKDAELLAEAYATMKGSAIFCTSRMSVGERTKWFTAFAETFLAKNKGRVRVVIDEAHVFMPKAGGRADVRRNEMLNAGNELVSQGRSMGLRIVLASQRSAKLHNDALTQCPCLIAMQLMAPHDRDAVKAWIEDQADPARGKEIISSLATLRPGEAWVWAPNAGMLERKRFPMPTTFDSSAAPDDDAGDVRALAPINLDALKGKLATVEAERKANDPAELKNEVARLKKANDDLRKEMIAAVDAKIVDDPQALENAEKRGFERAKREAVDAAKTLLIDAVAAIEKDVNPFVEAVSEAVHKLRVSTADRLRGLVRERHAYTPVYSIASVNVSRPPPNGHLHSTAFVKPVAQVGASKNDRQELPPGERAILVAAIQYEGVDRDQLSVLTGYKRSSRDAYIQRLREKGYVKVSGQSVIPTDDGRGALGPDCAPLPTGEDLQRFWHAKLPEGERKILDALIAAYPADVQRTDLDDSTGYKRSSRDAYIQRLKARRLLTVDGSTVRASDTLF